MVTIDMCFFLCLRCLSHAVADLSLDYVEMLLFENAKLRVAVDEMSNELNKLTQQFANKQAAAAHEQNLRAFERANPALAKTLEQVYAETLASCELLDKQTAAVRAEIDTIAKAKAAAAQEEARREAESSDDDNDDDNDDEVNDDNNNERDDNKNTNVKNDNDNDNNTVNINIKNVDNDNLSRNPVNASNSSDVKRLHSEEVIAVAEGDVASPPRWP